jgi:hypothetical protein
MANLERIAFANTVLLCAVIMLTIAIVIGVFCQRANTLVTDEYNDHSMTTSSTISTLSAQPTNVYSNRDIVVPMGYSDGTYIVHMWISGYSSAFQMRVDTGASVLLIGDLPGCADLGVCTTVEESAENIGFGAYQDIAVMQTTLRPDCLSLGYQHGVSWTANTAIVCRTADHARTFDLPLGFGSNEYGFMAQLGVRRVRVVMAADAWASTSPSQIVLSPSPAPRDVIFRAALVATTVFLSELHLNLANPPTWVFRIVVDGVPKFAVVDLGSTLNYVPGHVLGTDTILEVDHQRLTLISTNTVALTPDVGLGFRYGSGIVIIGNRSLHGLTADVDLDDGASGTFRLCAH